MPSKILNSKCFRVNRSARSTITRKAMHKMQYTRTDSKTEHDSDTSVFESFRICMEIFSFRYALMKFQ